MALVTCAECGHDVSDQADTCPSCGADDPTSTPGVSCPECGESVSENDKTCPGCGYPDPAAAAHSEGLQSLSSSSASKSEDSSDSSFRRSGVVVVENPRNGYRKSFKNPGAKVLFTGSLYFLAHGMWSRAFLGFLIGLITVGFGWLYVAWKAEDYIKDHYQSQGWRVVAG